MKILELFAGSRSIGKEAEKLGYEVFSVDIERFNGIDLVIDIEELKPYVVPFIPEIVWASPPCTTYSIAAISHHRNGQEPKTPFASKSDRLIKNVVYLIGTYLKINPELKWYIENPRGMLRKMDFMQGLPRTTVCYCKYGDNRMKPTDVWSNNINSYLIQEGGNPAQCAIMAILIVTMKQRQEEAKQGLRGLKATIRDLRYLESFA